MIRSLCGLIAASLFATSVSAEVLCVNPAKKKCFATIQEAVDQAIDGDKIEIAENPDPKGYRESVLVETANLKLVGVGEATAKVDSETCPDTILDGCNSLEDPSACKEEPAVTVAAPGVTLRSLTVRHASDGIAVQAPGVRLTDMCFIDNNGDIASDEELSSDDLLVEDSVFRGGQSDGVSVSGDRVVIDGNKFFVVDDGVDIDGDDAIVKNNLFNVGNDACIEISGSRAKVKNNVVKSCDDAIQVAGDQPTIVGNRVEGSPDANIDVDCNNDEDSDSDGSTCTGGSISDNIVVGNSDDDEGLDIRGFNLLISGNDISLTSEGGIEYFGNNATITLNKVTRAGSESPSSESGMRIEGDDNTVSDNEVRLTSFAGIRVNGDGNTLTGNKAIQSGRSGIWLESGDANVVQNNTVRRSSGEGINNSALATNTVIEDNVSKANRTDVCNDGTVASFVGNTFGTGDEQTACEVETVEVIEEM